MTVELVSDLIARVGSAVAIDGLVLQLRLLAIWLCPSVLSHRVVWQHCWLPLLQTWVDPTLVRAISEVFPQSFEVDRSPGRGPGTPAPGS